MGRASKLKLSKEEKADREKQLRDALADVRTIYSIVTHVAKSGMSRRIKLFIGAMQPDYHHDPSGDTERPAIVEITWLVAIVLKYQFDFDDHTILVHGCGMDMCFATVYALGKWFKPHGFQRTGTDSRGSVGTTETDGGYYFCSARI